MVIHVSPLGRPIDTLRYRSGLSLKDGDLVRVPLGPEHVPACVISVEEASEDGLKDIEELMVPGLLPQGLLRMAENLAREHLGFLGEALGLILPRDIMSPPKRTIKESGQHRLEIRLRMRADELGILEIIEKSRKPVLIQSSADYTALLVRLVKDALAKEHEVLLLLPHEPSLAKLYERLNPHLPITLYHSAMSQGERRRTWHGVRKGEIPLVAGMRSAVFLPFTRLGLIVVFDEEHESYRVRSHHLHYSARDLAVARDRAEGSRLLLFSLVPRLETSHEARSGKFTLIERRVPQRGKALIVDMHNEPEEEVLSKPLLKELEKARKRGMQALLLLNRLGIAARLLCLDCGHVLSCPECGIPLKFTSPGKPLTCNICTRTFPAPERCPDCGGVRWQSLSPGLGKLDSELKRFFPDDILCEITGERRPLLEETVRAGIIYGTSAALEYLPPRVQVAAALSWDAERSRPDFRSSENAFRDIAYLRRMLASTPESRLVIQTFRPQDRLLRWALRGDYETFFKSETRRRRELGYPPYHRLVLFERTNLKNAWDPEKLSDLLTRDGAEILGPYSGRQARQTLLIKLRRDLSPGELLDARTLLRSGWQAEVDPVEIL